MCDTYVVKRAGEQDKFAILAKNSDREPNEPQAIVRFLGGPTHSEHVQCTYIEIPQVKHTYEVILSKPTQMWGAEMGINEHGLAIGNEAVFTRFRFKKTDDGLTGMDMNRLVLERCTTAREGVELLAELVETYGQDACGGYENKSFYYHNSFLLNDDNEAWIFETADRYWVAKQVKSDRYAISNGLTIENDYDLGTDELEEIVRKKRWVKKNEPFSFKKTFSDKLYTHFSKCQTRSAWVAHSARTGQLEEAIDILSSHTHDDPTCTDAASICVHGNSLLNPSVSTGSMIVERESGYTTCWLTGTSNPCMSIYVPHILGGKALFNDHSTQPSLHPDTSLWWEAELLHRAILRNYGELFELIREDRQILQQKIIEDYRRLQSQHCELKLLDEFSSETFLKVKKKVKEWRDLVNSHKVKKASSLRYRIYMRSFNKRVGI